MFFVDLTDFFPLREEPFGRILVASETAGLRKTSEPERRFRHGPTRVWMNLASPDRGKMARGFFRVTKTSQKTLPGTEKDKKNYFFSYNLY